MEAADNDKHASLLRRGKKFYTRGLNNSHGFQIAITCRSDDLTKGRRYKTFYGRKLGKIFLEWFHLRDANKAVGITAL